MKKLLAAVLCLITSCSGAKPLYIEITGGNDFAIPVTVLNFADKPSISGIIRADLKNSGQFKVLPPPKSLRKLSTDKRIHTTNWQQQGIEYLITGNLHAKPDSSFDVIFHLYDVNKTPIQPILSFRYQRQLAANLRSLAHHISNKIYEKLLGTPGYFLTKIAYITALETEQRRTHSLVVADVDGHNDKALLTTSYPLMSPRWSPDGKRLAFVSFPHHQSNINFIELATGKIETISREPGINGAPAWSPDGKSLALVLSKGGAPKIYLMDLRTKQLQQLTFGRSIDTEPCWDPNGRSILFTSNRGGKPQIYRLDLTTNKVNRITFVGKYNATPRLTSDGRRLVMLHRGQHGNFNIGIQDLVTGSFRLLTSAKLDESPTLSPNDMMILYGTKGSHSKTALAAVSVDGKFRMRLPLLTGHVKEPAWSPYLM